MFDPITNNYTHTIYNNIRYDSFYIPDTTYIDKINYIINPDNIVTSDNIVFRLLYFPYSYNIKFNIIYDLEIAPTDKHILYDNYHLIPRILYSRGSDDILLSFKSISFLYDKENNIYDCNNYITKNISNLYINFNTDYSIDISFIIINKKINYLLIITNLSTQKFTYINGEINLNLSKNCNINEIYKLFLIKSPKIIYKETLNNNEKNIITLNTNNISFDELINSPKLIKLLPNKYIKL